MVRDMYLVVVFLKSCFPHAEGRCEMPRVWIRAEWRGNDLGKLWGVQHLVGPALANRVGTSLPLWETQELQVQQWTCFLLKGLVWELRATSQIISLCFSQLGRASAWPPTHSHTSLFILPPLELVRRQSVPAYCTYRVSQTSYAQKLTEFFSGGLKTHSSFIGSLDQVFWLTICGMIPGNLYFTTTYFQGDPDVVNSHTCLRNLAECTNGVRQNLESDFCQQVTIPPKPVIFQLFCAHFLLKIWTCTQCSWFTHYIHVLLYYHVRYKHTKI